MRKIKWNLLLLAGMFVAVSCKEDDDDVTISEVDRNFAMTAAETNLLGVQTGQLVATKAEAQDVKDYSLTLTEYYDKATTDLNALAQRRNITLPTTLGTTNQQEYTTLNGLMGAKFDSAYIDWAVRSNQRAIETLQDYRSETADTEFQTWVDSRITTLESNLETATSIQESMNDQ
jgi:putative membrane protein